MSDELSLPLGPDRFNTWRAGPRRVDLTRPHRPERPVTVEALPKTVTFDLAASAVIVVDMQNDFCHPKGWLAGIGVDVAPARAPIEPLRRLLPDLRAKGVPVLFVNWGNRPDRANLSPTLFHVYKPLTGPAAGFAGLGEPLPETGSRVLEKDAWSARTVDELAPLPGDILVDKSRMSGFWDTPLDSILRQRRVTTLLFAGVNLDQCVLHTLADGNFLGYDTLLLEDCAATTSPDYCRAATLYNVRQIFGFTLTSGDLLKAM
jgi:nicotinamidase-related amidase